MSELGAMIPRSGGYYVFVKRAFGDYAGFVIGWADWLSLAASELRPRLENAIGLARVIGRGNLWWTTFITRCAFLNTDVHGAPACRCSISRCRTVLMFAAGTIKCSQEFETARTEAPSQRFGSMRRRKTQEERS
jgi:hypothetical protein